MPRQCLGYEVFTYVICFRVEPMTYNGPLGYYNTGSDDGTRPGTFVVNLMRPSEM